MTDFVVVRFSIRPLILENLKVVFSIFSDIVYQDFHILVAIWSRMLMKQTHTMKNFMNYVMSLAKTSNFDILSSTLSSKFWSTKRFIFCWLCKKDIVLIRVHFFSKVKATTQDIVQILGDISNFGFSGGIESKWQGEWYHIVFPAEVSISRACMVVILVIFFW